MTYNLEIHHRRSIRLRGYDYACGGAYFITLCAQDRECPFGEIAGGEMRMNDAGRTVEEWWAKLADKFPGVELDKYIVMPNHMHGIVVIHDVVGAGLPRPGCKDGAIEKGGETLGGETPPLQRGPTLGQIVGYFKYQTTKQINIIRDNPGVPVWQRNYYERIIRNETELAAIREYIATNPQHWGEDEEHPDHAQLVP